MTETASQLSAMIDRARGGDDQALGELLERYGGWLRVLAEREIGIKLAARVSASDIVQKTFLSACRNFPQFAGVSEAELAVWLRRIHERNIRDTIRNNVQVQKRALGDEQPLDSGVELLDGLGGRPKPPSPSQRAMEGEAAIRLAQAMERLPPDQREAVRLRHLEGWTLAQIIEHMGRSKDAVASLIKRGLENLRQHLRTID